MHLQEFSVGALCNQLYKCQYTKIQKNTWIQHRILLQLGCGHSSCRHGQNRLRLAEPSSCSSVTVKYQIQVSSLVYMRSVNLLLSSCCICVATGIWISKFWGSSGIYCRQHAFSSSETCTSAAQGFPGCGIHGTIAVGTCGSQPNADHSCRRCPRFLNFLEDRLNLNGAFNRIGVPNLLFWLCDLLTPSIQWYSISCFVLGHHLPRSGEHSLWWHHITARKQWQHPSPVVGTPWLRPHGLIQTFPPAVEPHMCWAFALPAPATCLSLLVLEERWGEPGPCSELRLHSWEAHVRNQPLPFQIRTDIVRTLPKPNDVRRGPQAAAKKPSSQFAIALCFFGVCTTADEAGELDSAYSVVGIEELCKLQGSDSVALQSQSLT